MTSYTVLKEMQSEVHATFGGHKFLNLFNTKIYQDFWISPPRMKASKL